MLFTFKLQNPPPRLPTGPLSHQLGPLTIFQAVNARRSLLPHNVLFSSLFNKETHKTNRCLFLKSPLPHNHKNASLFLIRRLLLHVFCAINIIMLRAYVKRNCLHHRLWTWLKNTACASTVWQRAMAQKHAKHHHTVGKEGASWSIIAVCMVCRDWWNVL